MDTLQKDDKTVSVIENRFINPGAGLEDGGWKSSSSELGGGKPKVSNPLPVSSSLFRMRLKLNGILPIAKSTVSNIGSIWALDDETTSGFLDLGWTLVGQGKPYADCGTIRFRGCLNVTEHYQALDREQSGKAFVQAYRRSCGRKECPVCRESWAGLEAGRIEFRLGCYAGRWRKPVHVSVNPEPNLWSMGFENMRLKAYKVLKKVGFVGGSVTFHPFRQNKAKKWFFSPHFHMIGYGWHNGFHVAGWVVKNHGVRKSVHATAMYQLSHAGVHKNYHTTTWFGKLSYNKLKTPPIVEEKPKCPLCGSELLPLLYTGGEDPPKDKGDYFLDVRDWFVYYNYP